MGMTTIVRLECDKCMSHRDLTVGNTEDLGISSGLPMLIRYRAADIGWRIHRSNAEELCLCERCCGNGPSIGTVVYRGSSAAHNDPKPQPQP